MSEFDENRMNQGNPERDDFSSAPAKDENRSEGVVFEEDGTYHGKAVNSDAAENSASQQRPDQGNDKTQNNRYPYGNSNASQGYQNNYNYYNSSRSAYPYQNSTGGYSGQSGQNFYQQQNNPDYGYAYSKSNGNDDKKKNKGVKVFVGILAAICVFLVIALIAVAAGGNDSPDSPEEEKTTTASGENAEEFVTSASPETGLSDSKGEMTPKAIFNKVLESSAGILVYDKSKALASEGSGVLFQESADKKYTYIVTCAHVINEESGLIRVQLFDGKEYDAELVGFDTRTDIGVIRIEKTGLKLAEIGDSTKISVGDFIYAIGNPGGVEFANSFTDGIVSALDRPVNSSATGYTTECIQHTAAINPGNSGGALVNSFGQVVGINSMKIVADEYEGMGFAVPSSVFVEIVNEIMAHGYVSNRPKLGITYVAASEYSTYGMFVAIKGLPSGSIVIYEISEDSALKGTEAKAGDMIIAVNGKSLDDASLLSEIIEQSDVGDKLTLTLVRIFDDYSSEEIEVVATLVEDRGDTVIKEEEETTRPYPGNGNEDYYGSFFEDYFKDFFNDYYGGNTP